MKRQQRFGINSLNKILPTEEACLGYIFDTLHSRKCSCGGLYSPIKGRKQFQCSKCRFQIAPTANTIFHKSETPLKLWFHAIILFSNAKSGLSGKYLERELEVTYKTAYRMLKLIRQALPQNTMKLRGEVEIDTGYFGGKRYGGKNNEQLGKAMEKKIKVIAAVERGGYIKAEVVKDSGTLSMAHFLEKNVQRHDTSLMSDSSKIYINTAREYDRQSVNHSKGQFVVENVHINGIETFFAHLKRSIRGTFKVISHAQFQSYLDVFVFQYNNRYSDKARFETLLGALLPKRA